MSIISLTLSNTFSKYNHQPSNVSFLHILQFFPLIHDTKKLEKAVMNRHKISNFIA